jgi:hypothetical protein
VSPQGSAFASPVYDSVRPWLERLPPEGNPGLEELNAMLDSSPKSGGGVPIRFVRPDAARARTYSAQFEVRTYLRGEVAVRDGSWHDVFNALAWLAFPFAKNAINRRHFADLERERKERGVTRSEEFKAGGKRSALRDALTLFDESGIIVACPNPELLDLIRRRRWKSLFQDYRAEVGRQMRCFVLGHALHEKAMSPYKSMTARSLLIAVPESFLELPGGQQCKVADRLAAAHLLLPAGVASTQDVSPLPVMGIPGWSENDIPGFYDDAMVFR